MSPAAGAAIIAANHVSFFDSVVLTLAVPRPPGRGRECRRRITSDVMSAIGELSGQGRPVGPARTPVLTDR